jgi:tRNA(adenine34) deaminase
VAQRVVSGQQRVPICDASQRGALSPVSERVRIRKQTRIGSLGEPDFNSPNRQLAGTPHPGVTELDIAMMRRALRLAEQAAAMGEVPIGAVVYRGDRVIAEAFNLRESVSDPTGHAELLAIRKAGQVLGEWRLNDCSLAVTLEPCPMCAGGLVNARLGRLIYGAADPKAGACETLYEIPVDNRLNHRVSMHGGVLADECRRQLREFFQRRRRDNK